MHEQVPVSHVPNNNPMSHWLEKNVFPCKLVLCIAIIVATTSQVVLLSQQAADHSRQFTRMLNFFVLDHKGFDYYWIGYANFNYPIEEYRTLTEFNDFLGNTIDFFLKFNETTFEQLNQEEYNTKQNGLLIVYKNATSKETAWTLKQGITDPFRLNNTASIKSALSDAEYMQLTLAEMNFQKSGHKWVIKIMVSILESTTLQAQIYCFQEMSLFKYHIPGLLCCLLLLPCLLLLKIEVNILDGVVYFVLFLSTFYNLRVTSDLTLSLILDGVTCGLCWVWLPQVFPLTGRFNFTVLLGKSYLLIGRLFITFLPIFIGFSMLAYCMFSRLTDKYFTLKRSLLQLFYVSYYNMTYETFVTTERLSPLSSVFIFVFILLFTFTIYSSMLVTSFCAYAWDIREEQLIKDIKDNLVIQCSNCEYKFQYKEEDHIERKIPHPYIHMDSGKQNKLKYLYMSRVSACNQKMEIVINELKLLYQQLQPAEKPNIKKMLLSLYRSQSAVSQNLRSRVRERLEG